MDSEKQKMSSRKWLPYLGNGLLLSSFFLAFLALQNINPVIFLFGSASATMALAIFKPRQRVTRIILSLILTCVNLFFYLFFNALLTKPH